MEKRNRILENGYKYLNQEKNSVFLSLSGKAREAVLEMNPDGLNMVEGLKLSYEKLDSLFKMDTNQVVLMEYRNFENYTRPQNVTIANFNVEFNHMIQQLCELDNKLPDAIVAYKALKSAILEKKN